MKNKILLSSILLIVLILGLSTITAADTTTTTSIEKQTIDTTTTTSIDNKEKQAINNDNKEINSLIKDTTTKKTKDSSKEVSTTKETTKNNEVKSSSLKTIKNTNIIKTKNLKLENSTTVEKTQTVTDYDSLKSAWNNIQEYGVNNTEYTINLKNGVYKFQNTLTTKTKKFTLNITLTGENRNNTILDGENSVGLFKLQNTNQIIKFTNLTFINGKTTNGGAIESTCNLITIDNCVFANNAANANGGALNTKSFTINNSVFENNTGKFGSAIYSAGESGLITNSLFTKNNASKTMISKATIYFTTAELTIDRCNFTDNIALGYSVLFKVGYPPKLTLTNSHFINNTGRNAVIYLHDISYRSPQYIGNCVFVNNRATSGSNDIYNGRLDTDGICVFESCYFDGEYKPTKAYTNVDKLEASNVAVLPNNNIQGSTFTQKDEILTLKAWSISKYNEKEVTRVGNGYSIDITSDNSIIKNTTLNTDNNFTTTFDLRNLPENFEDFSIYANGVKVATVTYKKTDISIKPIVVKTGSNIKFNATITSKGELVGYGKVAFKINGKTIGYSNVSFGKASLDYTIPKYAAKNYNITVVYGENKKYAESRVNTTLTLTKLDTKTTVTANTSTPNILQININTVDENDTPVFRGKVVAKINGKTVSKIVNTTGTVTINFTLPTSWKNKTITVSGIYGENTVFMHSSDEIKTTVSSQTTKTLRKSIKTEDTINNYYVSNNGLDTNSGTESAPFKTIAKAISIVNATKTPANIYLLNGTYTGENNTNLTVDGNLKINFIGLNATIDGQANYTIKETLDPGEYYWGSSRVWWPYYNGTGNWAMNITKGSGLITLTNLTIKNCWNPGASNINLYNTSTVDNYGNLEVDNVSFINNCGGVGAGIRNNNGSTLVVNNSLFDGNRKSSSTGNYGAGIYNNGTATIINSTFQNNYARWGTVTSDKHLTIINSTFKNNIGYDGGSTYKFGSGIAINTGSADFFDAYNITSIYTTIDGCTFINNDQLDVYADKGHLNLTNCLFNKSTCVYVPSASENLTITYNITNNTFISPIGSSLYNSLSSKDNITFALRLYGSYNYTIENNKVTNLTGTSSKTIELYANHAAIKNNTVDRKITINGEYNTIINNNITTTLDSFAIDISSQYGNNKITNNYLSTNGLKGNAAVNYTQLSNNISNNKPETLLITIDDSTYSKYFDVDGNLLPAYSTVGQIQITGTLSNKKFNFNKTVSLIQIDKKVTLYNITITTTENGHIDINGIIIVNTNNNPVIVLNSNNNKIEKTNLKTNNKYTITTTKTNNTIINNELVADILVGDDSVNAPADNTINSNTPTYINYILSEDTYSTFFDENGILKPQTTPKDIHFLINGTIANKNIILNNNMTITITNYNNALLINSTITTLGTTNLNMSNIKIVNTNNKVAIELNTPTNTILYNNITTNTNAINVINSTTLTINYNNITATGTSNVTAISIKNSKTSLNIQYNNIKTTGPSLPVDWTTGRVGTNSLEILNTTRMIISYNNITTTYNSVNGEYDTIYSINIVNPEHLTLPNQVYSNNIYTYGNNYAYGINMINQSVYLMHDNIITKAKVQATGVQATQSSSYILGGGTYGIINIDFISSSPYAYGVVLSLCDDLTIQGNKFKLNGTNSIGISIYTSKNTIIESNDFKLDGDIQKAIEIIKSNITTITSNIIDTNATNTTHAPIELLNTTNTLVTRNTITTNTEYTMIIDEYSVENPITENILYANELLGDESVLKLNSNNIIRGNSPKEISDFKLNDNTYHQFFNDDGTLKDEVPAGLKIQVTGILHNKLLNITKPINIISNKITFDNCILIISSDNTNITGLQFTGENTQITINGNNNNIEIIDITIENTKSKNLTPLIINGNKNTINVTDISINSNLDLNSNTTLVTITGNYNNINLNHDFIETSLNKLTGVLFNNANNNSLSVNYLSPQYINDATDIMLLNSNGNKLNLKQIRPSDSKKVTGLLLDNSSYNYITGLLDILRTCNESTSILIKNHSDNNKIESLNVYGLSVINTPMIIENSNNNNIMACTFTYNNYEGYAIEIKEGVNNTIEYNIINTKTLTGDNAILQENINDTVNNIVRYNYEKAGIPVALKLTTPTTTKINETITIIANVTTYNIPNINGTITFRINGIEQTYDVVDGIVEITYTITEKDGDKLLITAIYKDPSLTNNINIENTTILIEKNAVSLIVGNTTNKGSTATLTAILLDENSNIINNGKVAFKINGKTVGIANITGGVAILTIDTTKYNTGSYTITVTYGGTAYYATATNEGILTIKNYNVKMTVEPTTAKTTNTITLTSHIIGEDNKQINNGKAIFKLNGKTLKDEFGNIIYTKIVNGIATINYTLPNTISAKTYTITVVAQGKNYDRIEANSTLTVQKTNTQLILQPQYLNRNTTNTIKATIVDEEGELVVGTTKVAIKLNNKTIINTIATNGILNTPIDLTNYKNNIYNITIIAGENSLYNSSKATNAIIIK